MKMNKKMIITVVLFIAFAFSSCEANVFVNKLSDTSWRMEGKEVYLETLDFDKPEEGQFSWGQYSDGIEIDRVIGSYETFSSVLSGESYANLQLILEEGQKNICYEYYLPDPSKDGRATLWIIGHEKTIYTRVVDVETESEVEVPEEEEE